MVKSFLKNLFSGSSTKQDNDSIEPVLHKDFKILVTPRQSGSQWQIAGRIEKTVGETTREHVFIRADTLSSREEAAEHTLRKAKLLIDQQGDSLFD